jgi:hypothetical protein
MKWIGQAQDRVLANFLPVMSNAYADSQCRTGDVDAICQYAIVSFVLHFKYFHVWRAPPRA